jgi:urease gamma subunit
MLTYGQLDKLVIAQLGFLAQKRLARGVKLNHSEACVCRHVCMSLVSKLTSFQALIASNLQEVGIIPCFSLSY